MLRILDTMFDWPQGIVVGNLIASGITGTLVVIHQHVRIRHLAERIRKLEGK